MDDNKEVATMNGSSKSDQVIDGIAAIVRHSEDRAQAKPAKTMADIAAPFPQRQHTELLKLLENLTNDCLARLRDDRHSSEQLEAMVVQRAAKTMTDLNLLFLCDSALTNKTQRDAEFRAKLAEELDKLTEERFAS